MCISLGDSIALIIGLGITATTLLYTSWAIHQRDVEIRNLQRIIRLTEGD